MTVVFPTLVGEMAKRGIKKATVADRIGISVRAFYNKLSGKAPFTWDEVLTITNCFFPDMDPATLFQRVSKEPDT